MVNYKNRYPGINPHLNSRLQSPGGGWESFHHGFIEKLIEELDIQLPENYYPIEEKSIQIGIVDTQTGATMPKPGSTRPDVLIVRERPAASASSASLMIPTLILPVAEGFDEEEFLMGIMVYHVEGKNLPGKPITRIEVLSPANKPGGTHHAQYLRNRRDTLLGGLRLVEIDWLHELPPVISGIPSYPDRELDSYPYSIIISDPRPSLTIGQTRVYGFGINQVVPMLNLPLDNQDEVAVDFGRLYNELFNRRVFTILTDYSQFPARFESYSDTDQSYIRQRMAEINKMP